MRDTMPFMTFIFHIIIPFPVRNVPILMVWPPFYILRVLILIRDVCQVAAEQLQSYYCEAMRHITTFNSIGSYPELNLCHIDPYTVIY